MASSAAAGGSREARRRRIVDRGDDRLALITGRIQSLPPHSASLPAQTPADVARNENAPSNSEQESHQGHTSDKAKVPLLENSIKGEVFSSPLGVEEEQSQIPEKQPQSHQIKSSHYNLFTSGNISSAISSSENTRICVSAAAAILVVTCCCNIGTKVISKPFYLLLLTNISIVLAWLILGTRASKVRPYPRFSDNHLVDRMGKTLEMGLLLQKIFEAMFMDFGIYAVVLICGLSLVRVLGW